MIRVGTPSVDAVSILLLLLLLVFPRLAFVQPSSYEYKEADETYHAVEGRRIVQLKEIKLRETSSPFKSWKSVLIEPCSTREESVEDELPCWPSDAQKRTQELRARLATQMPEGRQTSDLLRAAGFVNRGIGAFHPAWVVGTHPLAVAFRRGTGDPNPYEDLPLRHGATTRPTAIPGQIELVTRSGRTTIIDRRARDVQLVNTENLDVEADVLLLFPPEMHLPWGQVRSPSATQPAPKARVFYLREPMSLGSIMRAMTEAGALEREAERVEEVDVEPA